MRHADYEIYEVKKFGKHYWAFDVEYFGHFTARSHERIQQKINEVKIRVAQTLEWIEEENKRYYEQLAAAELERKKALREYRELQQEIDAKIGLLPVDDKRARKILIRTAKEMILNEYPDELIMEILPMIGPRTISRLKNYLKTKKVLQENPI